MVTKNDLFLQPITDFFSKLNLARIRQDFENTYYDENTQTYSGHITEEGVYKNYGFISYYEVYQEKFKKELENARLHIIAVMANGPKNQAKLRNYIQHTLKSFLANNSEDLKVCPGIKTEVENFSRFLFREFSIKLSLKTERFKPTSVFGFKTEQYNIRTLSSLYSLSINSEIFDEEEVSEETFIQVLTDANSNAVLSFCCDTPVMVAFLQLISIFFRRLDKKHIIASNRFYTSSGTVLTSPNFDTAKNRLAKNAKASNVLEMIIKFTEKQIVS